MNVQQPLIIKKNFLSKQDDMFFLKVPKTCVKYIVFGKHTACNTKEAIETIFGQEPSYYDFRISRTNIQSFFLSEKEAYIYDESSKTLQTEYLVCSECFEPIDNNVSNKNLCFWCYLKSKSS